MNRLISFTTSYILQGYKASKNLKKMVVTMHVLYMTKKRDDVQTSEVMTVTHIY